MGSYTENGTTYILDKNAYYRSLQKDVWYLDGDTNRWEKAVYLGAVFDNTACEKALRRFTNRLGLELMIRSPEYPEQVNEFANSFMPPVAGLEIGASRLAHIFRNSAGHVDPQALASKLRYLRLFKSVASNAANVRNDAVAAKLITPDAAKAGVQAFTQSFRNGCSQPTTAK